MRTSVLCAFILLGAGVAAADPKPPTSAPPTHQVIERKPELQQGRLLLKEPAKTTIKKKEPIRTPGDWVELADPTPAKHGTEFVVVGAQQGSFSQLRINAAKGATTVRSVRVMFSDGTEKTMKLGKTVKGNKFAVVDLGAEKPIWQVVVTTDRQGSGEYSVYGSSGPAPGTVVSSR